MSAIHTQKRALKEMKELAYSKQYLHIEVLGATNCTLRLTVSLSKTKFEKEASVSDGGNDEMERVSKALTDSWEIPWN